MDDILQSATLERRFETDLLQAFSFAALFISALGLFGVASLSVTRRMREFGIRSALGASGIDILWLEVKRNGQIIFAGLAIGLLLCYFTQGLLKAFLFGVSPLSGRIYAIAVSVLTGSAAIAVFIPVLRAVRLNPASVLRHE